jgi:uncharacterized membrane protein YphA (DoxX/SURF4 family)
MIAGMFISGGVDAMLHPDAKAPRAQAVTQPITDTLGIADDPATFVRINGAVMVVGGVLLGTGRVPRLAAIVLGATLIPTTLAAHRFWEIDDPTQRAQQRVHFLKNVSMFGGLILAATDTEGRPSLSWRARKRAQQALDALPTGS